MQDARVYPWLDSGCLLYGMYDTGATESASLFGCLVVWLFVRLSVWPAGWLVRKQARAQSVQLGSATGAAALRDLGTYSLSCSFCLANS